MRARNGINARVTKRRTVKDSLHGHAMRQTGCVSKQPPDDYIGIRAVGSIVGTIETMPTAVAQSGRYGLARVFRSRESNSEIRCDQTGTSRMQPA